MPFKFIRIEPDDTEGHAFKWGEDLTGQAVTVRMEDGTEVEGHVIKRGEDMTGDDAEGHRTGHKEDLTGDDAEGHAFKHIDLEVDDTQANMLSAATDKGEPVYVRFPDDAEVQGHLIKRG